MLRLHKSDLGRDAMEEYLVGFIMPPTFDPDVHDFLVVGRDNDYLFSRCTDGDFWFECEQDN